MVDFYMIYCLALAVTLQNSINECEQREEEMVQYSQDVNSIHDYVLDEIHEELADFTRKEHIRLLKYRKMLMEYLS